MYFGLFSLLHSCVWIVMQCSSIFLKIFLVFKIFVSCFLQKTGKVGRIKNPQATVAASMKSWLEILSSNPLKILTQNPNSEERYPLALFPVFLLRKSNTGIWHHPLSSMGRLAHEGLGMRLDILMIRFYAYAVPVSFLVVEYSLLFEDKSSCHKKANSLDNIFKFTVVQVLPGVW